MVEQRILEAFEMMWGPFPEPVMLIHRDRTVLAVNDFARSMGVQAGIKCFSLNPEAAGARCKHCKADFALGEQRAACIERTRNGNRVITYWMPLKEEKDVYVHFGVGLAEAMGFKTSSPEPA